jgi:hypothetical protein
MPQPPMSGIEIANCPTHAGDDNVRRRLLDSFMEGAKSRHLGFENEGGIASISKPARFNKTNTDNDFGRYVEQTDGKSKICYWKRDDYSPQPQSAKKMADILNKGPHAIKEGDMDPVYDCLQPGRWSNGGPFDVNRARVEKVNGKNVLAVDVDFQSGKKTTVYIFNPDAAGKTLEHLWVEAPNKVQAANLNKSVLSSIKWKVK